MHRGMADARRYTWSRLNVLKRTKQVEAFVGGRRFVSEEIRHSWHGQRRFHCPEDIEAATPELRTQRIRLADGSGRA